MDEDIDMDEIKKKLGQALRDERERQNISLEDLASKLKISEANLLAVETANISGLPSELYFNLFAKSYCEALGIDFTKTVDAIKFDIEDAKNSIDKNNYPSRNGDGESDDDQFESRSPTLTGHWMLYATGLIVLICFVIIYSYMFDSNGEEKTEADIREEIVEESLKTQFAGYDWNTPKFKTAKPLSLSLSAKEESWATILTDGDTVIFRNLIPGKIYYVEGKYRLQISIGIPRNVNIILNGKAVDLIDSETRRISRVKIDQLNINSFLNQVEKEVKKEIKNEAKKEQTDSSPPSLDGE